MAYVRKTHDEWTIEGNYGYGWDVLTTETTRTAAREMLKTYRENEPQYSHRIKKHRVKNEV